MKARARVLLQGSVGGGEGSNTGTPREDRPLAKRPKTANSHDERETVLRCRDEIARGRGKRWGWKGGR